MSDADPRPAVASASKRRLLGAAIDLMAAEGGTGWSLRGLAERLGTSHRMVIYHFGSLEGLLVEVVGEVERRQRERRAVLSARFTEPAEAARALWAELSDPELAPHERLFFEMYAAGLQGHDYATSLVRCAVEEWLEPLTEAFSAISGDRRQAAVDARLGLAVVRGLLLDLLATGDRRATTAAHERYLELYFRGSQDGPQRGPAGP